MNDSYNTEHSHHEHDRHATPSAGMGVFESVFDFFAGALRTIAHEMELFLGAALTLIGLLSFKNDKFCDGNTADYLSCTRPSTFYYYDWLSIVLVVVGVTFVLIWLVRARRRG